MSSRPSTVYQANVLGSSVLGVTPGGLTAQFKGSTLKGLQRSIPVYYLGPQATDQDIQNILSVMTLFGRSKNTVVKAWQTWVLSLTCVCFPDLVTKLRAMKSNEYQLMAMPESFVDSVKTAFDKLQQDSDLSTPAIRLAGLPDPSGNIDADLYNAGTVTGLYAYYALVVHLMGKRIDPSTRDTITVRRPQNLMDTFRCHGSKFLLTGGGRMSDQAHSLVRDAWDLSTAPRKVIIDEFSRLKDSDDQTAQVVNLMFRMLEYSGMQPALFIKDFLSACPWVVKDMPSLVPAYEVYVNSVTAYASLDPDLRPYTKLYHGNNTKIFHSKSMQDLTAVSVMWLSVNNDTMSGYTAPGGDKAKAAFIKLAENHGIDLKTGALDPNVITAPVDTESEE